MQRQEPRSTGRKPYTTRYVKVKSTMMFTCQRCGKCCSTGPNVALTVHDVIRLSLFLRIDPWSFIENYTNVIIGDIIPFIVLKSTNGVCPLLERKVNGEPVCVVYPARPLRCRLYPLIIEGGGVYADKECPGLGSGNEKRVPQQLILQYNLERYETYRRLLDLVLVEGFEPLDALRTLIEEKLREALRGAKWANLDYIESLGSL